MATVYRISHVSDLMDFNLAGPGNYFSTADAAIAGIAALCQNPDFGSPDEWAAYQEFEVSVGTSEYEAAASCGAVK